MVNSAVIDLTQWTGRKRGFSINPQPSRRRLIGKGSGEVF
jgi:hypothetical protein